MFPTTTKYKVLKIDLLILKCRWKSIVLKLSLLANTDAAGILYRFSSLEECKNRNRSEWFVGRGDDTRVVFLHEDVTDPNNQSNQSNRSDVVYGTR